MNDLHVDSSFDKRKSIAAIGSEKRDFWLKKWLAPTKEAILSGIGITSWPLSDQPKCCWSVAVLGFCFSVMVILRQRFRVLCTLWIP